MVWARCELKESWKRKLKAVDGCVGIVSKSVEEEGAAL